MTARLPRRRFLQAAGLLALPALPAAPSPVIDTHVHFYDPTRPRGVPWPPQTDKLLYKPVLPAAFAALVRPLGVTGAIVIEASPWPEDNQWLLDLAPANPIIAGIIGHLEPGAAAFAADLARYSRNPLFRGIRLNGGAITTGQRNRRRQDQPGMGEPTPAGLRFRTACRTTSPSSTRPP